jgi:hypothetical protein
MLPHDFSMAIVLDEEGNRLGDDCFSGFGRRRPEVRGSRQGQDHDDDDGGDHHRSALSYIIDGNCESRAAVAAHRLRNSLCRREFQLDEKAFSAPIVNS